MDRRNGCAREHLLPAVHQGPLKTLKKVIWIFPHRCFSLLYRYIAMVLLRSDRIWIHLKKLLYIRSYGQIC